MAEHRYSAEQVDAAVAAIADGERFADAQELVTHAAPGLQQILGASLDAGGFFDSAHQAEITRVAEIGDFEQRRIALAELVAEESRLAMLVGVAVGLALADELATSSNRGKEQ